MMLHKYSRLSLLSLLVACALLAACNAPPPPQPLELPVTLGFVDDANGLRLALTTANYYNGGGELAYTAHVPDVPGEAIEIELLGVRPCPTQYPPWPARGCPAAGMRITEEIALGDLPHGEYYLTVDYVYDAGGNQPPSPLARNPGEPQADTFYLTVDGDAVFVQLHDGEGESALPDPRAAYVGDHLTQRDGLYSWRRLPPDTFWLVIAYSSRAEVHSPTAQERAEFYADATHILDALDNWDTIAPLSLTESWYAHPNFVSLWPRYPLPPPYHGATAELIPPQVRYYQYPGFSDGDWYALIGLLQGLIRTPNLEVTLYNVWGDIHTVRHTENATPDSPESPLAEPTPAPGSSQPPPIDQTSFTLDFVDDADGLRLLLSTTDYYSGGGTLAFVADMPHEVGETIEIDILSVEPCTTQEPPRMCTEEEALITAKIALNDLPVGRYTLLVSTENARDRLGLEIGDYDIVLRPDTANGVVMPNPDAAYVPNHFARGDGLYHWRRVQPDTVWITVSYSGIVSGQQPSARDQAEYWEQVAVMQEGLAADDDLETLGMIEAFYAHPNFIPLWPGYPMPLQLQGTNEVIPVQVTYYRHTGNWDDLVARVQSLMYGEHGAVTLYNFQGEVLYVKPQVHPAEQPASPLSPVP